MKTLHLIRHAKSSWKDESLSDFDRPLKKRGVNACKIMAARISDAGCSFEHVYSSPALRAKSTIKIISEHLPSGPVEWQTDDSLYTFDSRDLLAWAKYLDDALGDVVIVGHNPALTDFCNQISDSHLYNIPTCGYVRLHCHIDSWQALKAGTAELICFLKPKMFS